MRKKPLIQFFVVAFLLLVKTTPTYTQVAGCPDPYANNYNPAATINNGSCTYNVTYYTPPVKVNPISSVLSESSGLQWINNSLWSFNDSGGDPAIYRIDSASSSLLQTVNLENATNVDWEEISTDGTYFYIGDFGNNYNGARSDLKIYKFPVSAIPDYVTNPVVTIPKEKIEVISFHYSGHPTLDVTPTNNTRYDCEAMVVDGGVIHLFTKNWIDLNTTHYLINSTAAGSYTADSIETLQTNYLVTAASKVPGKNLIVLLGYQATGFGLHFMHILSDYSGGLFFSGNKRRLDLPDASQMGQAEGITFKNDRYGYISNEKLTVGPFVVTQKLRSFDISSFVSDAGSLLPESFTLLKAWQKNEVVEIDWQLQNDDNVKSFEVQKSADGKQFFKSDNVVAGNTLGNTYNWIDKKPYQGNNFYRIKTIDKSGSEKYSSVISIKIGGSNKSTIEVYPNPVINRSMTLKFTNQSEGNYLVKLFNNAGQQVYAKAVQIQAGSSTQVLQLNAGIEKGVYQLQVSSGNLISTQKVVCD